MSSFDADSTAAPTLSLEEIISNLNAYAAEAEREEIRKRTPPNPDGRELEQRLVCLVAGRRPRIPQLPRSRLRRWKSLKEKRAAWGIA